MSECFTEGTSDLHPARLRLLESGPEEMLRTRLALISLGRPTVQTTPRERETSPAWQQQQVKSQPDWTQIDTATETKATGVWYSPALVQSHYQHTERRPVEYEQSQNHFIKLPCPKVVSTSHSQGLFSTGTHIRINNHRTRNHSIHQGLPHSLPNFGHHSPRQHRYGGPALPPRRGSYEAAARDPRPASISTSSWRLTEVYDLSAKPYQHDPYADRSYSKPPDPACAHAQQQHLQHLPFHAHYSQEYYTETSTHKPQATYPIAHAYQNSPFYPDYSQSARPPPFELAEPPHLTSAYNNHTQQQGLQELRRVHSHQSNSTYPSSPSVRHSEGGYDIQHHKPRTVSSPEHDLSGEAYGGSLPDEGSSYSGSYAADQRKMRSSGSPSRENSGSPSREQPGPPGPHPSSSHNPSVHSSPSGRNFNYHDNGHKFHDSPAQHNFHDPPALHNFHGIPPPHNFHDNGHNFHEVPTPHNFPEDGHNFHGVGAGHNFHSHGHSSGASHGLHHNGSPSHGHSHHGSPPHGHGHSHHGSPHAHSHSGSGSPPHGHHHRDHHGHPASHQGHQHSDHNGHPHSDHHGHPHPHSDHHGQGHSGPVSHHGHQRRGSEGQPLHSEATGGTYGRETQQPSTLGRSSNRSHPSQGHGNSQHSTTHSQQETVADEMGRHSSNTLDDDFGELGDPSSWLSRQTIEQARRMSQSSQLGKNGLSPDPSVLGKPGTSPATSSRTSNYTGKQANQVRTVQRRHSLGSQATASMLAGSAVDTLSRTSSQSHGSFHWFAEQTQARASEPKVVKGRKYSIVMPQEEMDDFVAAPNGMDEPIFQIEDDGDEGSDKVYARRRRMLSY